jgi:hypothetical protein
VAQDERQSIGKRYKSLRYAAERYSSLTHTSFESVFDDLRKRSDLKVGTANNSAALVCAARELQKARHSFLEHLGSLAAQRRHEKRCGRRSPSCEWPTTLFSAVTLGRPLAVTLGRALAIQSAPAIPEETLAAIQRVATEPEFAIGEAVQVVLNSRNKTPRYGHIEHRSWHFKLHRWVYFIRQGSRRISKQYFADDLMPWTAAAVF